jgi:hypothetical protein
MKTASILLVFAAFAAPAFAHSDACLAPGAGGDDTGVLQAALDRCAGARRTCSVSLCRGVFSTGILRVRDFRGTLRGAGTGKTVLRALPELPVSSSFPDFFREDPLSPAGPWPYLVQLSGGRATIQDLAIEIPTPPAGAPGSDPARPTTGWFFFGGELRELAGALLLTGRLGTEFELRRIRVVAGPDAASELGTTSIAGVAFEGLLLNPDDPGLYPVHPLGGRFELGESSFSGMIRGVSLGELRQAEVTVRRNQFQSPFALSLIDADRSRLTVEGNGWQGAIRGAQVLQNLDGDPSRDSVLVVRGNDGTVAEGGDGFFFQDPFDASVEPGGATVQVSHNRLGLGDAAGAATSAVTVVGAGRLSIRANRVVGRAASALHVDATTGCRVKRNALDGLDTAGGPDLHLGPATLDCLAVVSRGDIVLDEGDGNRVIRR